MCPKQKTIFKTISMFRRPIQAQKFPLFLSFSRVRPQMWKKPLSYIPKNNMHTAQVVDWNSPPKYVEVDSPPEPGPDSLQIRVKAVGLHGLVRARASGKHYSAKTLPHVPGTDGVGFTPEGEAVYFSTFTTGGSFSDIVNVPKEAICPLPSGLDALQAAAFVNPGLSSWMALKTRTDHLPPNFCVFILGATSASGTIAVSLARALGAGKVIGCARNAEALSTLGLDGTVVLQNSVTETDFSSASDADIILDYVYGPPTEHLLTTLKPTKPVQYIHIGALAGVDINLPGSILRSKNLTIRGSGPGAFSPKRMAKEIPNLLDALKTVPPHRLKIAQLHDVETVWGEKGDRTVFLP